MPEPASSSRTGTYVLVLIATAAARLAVGRRLQLELAPGFYLYVGSAFGPGGVRARVDHHRKVSARPHWHIDFLRPHVRLDGVWYSLDPVRREHQWAAVLADAMPASTAVTGFGATDCGCGSHLFHFPSRPSFRGFVARVHARFPGHRRIHIGGPVDEP